MDKKSENDERFTGLILLSGVDSPGIFSALFSALEPFSINVLDIEQVVNRSRLILTVLIELDPAHAQAVEEDLNQCAEKLNVDIAVSFGSETIESLAQKNNLVHIIDSFWEDCITSSIFGNHLRFNRIPNLLCLNF